jgi:UDP-N-acetylmuramate dehydrogenase
MMAAGRMDETHILLSTPFAQFSDRLRPNADLSKTNWFRVGGPAEFLFKPQDVQDLAAFLALLPTEIPVTVLGVGSNAIIRDGGIEGVVVKLGRGFTECSVASGQLSVGAATLDLNLAQFACEEALAGLEFFAGIPGTVGGAVFMNGGAYGSDTSQVLVEAEIVERNGKIRTLTNAEVGFSYRHSA